MTETKHWPQLEDPTTLKPCRHTLYCQAHGRCISVTKKNLCPYRCRICAPLGDRHA